MAKAPPPCRKFWVVTRNTLYRVDSREGATPTVTVMAAQHPRWTYPIGHVFDRLDTVGIRSRVKGVVTFARAFGRDVDRIPEGDLGGPASTEVAALFLTKKQAMACYQARFRGPWDVRWQAATVRTLSRIGQEHPQFVVPHPKDINFG